MALSRRGFVRTLGTGAVAAVGGHILGGGRVIGPWTRDFGEALAAAQSGQPLLLLHNNENPLGPGEKAIAAMRAKLTERGYPAARYSSLVPDLSDALAAKYGCKTENIVIGCGSTQILRTATFAFASPEKPLVGGTPSYEECSDVAKLIGSPVKAVPGSSTLHHDLDAMADAARGAGLIFFDNPSNPAATLHPATAVAAFVEKVRQNSPDTGILIDEAYHDYVTDPGHKTQIPLALETPNLLVARTFSKAYGMAGLRIGYAIGRADTIKKMRELMYGGSTNVLGLAAALASINDQPRLEQEARRNTMARQFTLDWFAKNGFKATDSQCNFIFVDVKRPAKEFREACRKQDVVVGRDFPPFEKSHARISIGTIDEMRRAVGVFGQVLGVRAAAAA
jgi:histidinol-phosphate aminotransferase